MSSLPPNPQSISKSAFQSILSRYPSSIPASLQPLDTLRLTTIPALLATRRASADPHLTAADLLHLVDWKLAHGTFRPRLRALVAANTDVPAATREAYALLGRGEERAALQRVMRLSGVGPATASLVLATAEPERVPFFADEVFRWLKWGVEGGEVWDRRIGYTLKEYEGLVRWSRDVARRLGVGVREVECVAWVLGREGGGKGSVGRGKKGIAERKRKEESAGDDDGQKGKRPGSGDVKPSPGARGELSDEETQAPRRSKRLKVGA